jgi:hypothetical protein
LHQIRQLANRTAVDHTVQRQKAKRKTRSELAASDGCAACMARLEPARLLDGRFIKYSPGISDGYGS